MNGTWIMGAAVAGALVAGDRAEAGPIVVPFQLEADHIVITAAVNGKSGNFILDTGSSAATVTPEFAEGLDLSANQTVQAAGAGAAATQIMFGTAKAVDLGHSLTLTNMPIGVLPVNPFRTAGRPIAGALGYDVFARWTVQVDFAASTLRFIEPADYVVPKDAAVLEADLALRVPRVAVTVTPRAGAEAVPAKLVLDTGTPSFAMLLAPGFAAKNGIDKNTPQADLAIGMGTGGLSLGTVTRVAEASFAGVPLTRPVVGLPHDKNGFFASGLADGTVGQGLFRRGKLTLDYVHNRIVFEPGPDIAAAWNYPNRCGWYLVSDAAGAKVLHVSGGTPAAEAGVRAGDVITAVDGKPAQGMDRNTLRAACEASGPLAIAFTREGKPEAATLTRRALI
ncbi:MAG: aspartyl protease family protein [Alphaproteobacteria bacterium]|nr:aspartyl protease family protein [Alphaproteobacteria bacterium]